MIGLDGDEIGCSDCGQPIVLGSDVVFPFGSDGALCIECGLRRGGLYDASRDRWTRAPRIDDLLALWEARSP